MGGRRGRNTRESGGWIAAPAGHIGRWFAELERCAIITLIPSGAINQGHIVQHHSRGQRRRRADEQKWQSLIQTLPQPFPHPNARWWSTSNSRAVNGPPERPWTPSQRRVPIGDSSAASPNRYSTSGPESSTPDTTMGCTFKSFRAPHHHVYGRRQLPTTALRANIPRLS